MVKEDFHMLGHLGIQCRRYMAIRVQCQADGAVAKEFLHDLRMYSSREQVGSSRVAKIVNPDVG
jgi:hypothetical protein